jgi:hypothetical protein
MGTTTMRTRALLLATLASAAVGGAALAITHNDTDAVTKTKLTKVQLASASASTGAPTMLPAIAHLLSETDEPKAPDAVFRQYSLDGAANASNVTEQALLLNPKGVHPDTQLSISFVPRFTPPDAPFEAAWFTRSTVDVNGAAATVLTAKNGLGTERIDWVDAAGDYHVVMVDRLRTADGLSGLDVDTLLAIARSIGG